MYPRYRLSRRSRWLEHNQCRSLSYFPAQRSSDPSGIVTRRRKTDSPSRSPFSTRNVDKPVQDSLAKPSCLAFTALPHELGSSSSIQLTAMGVTVELQNLGDPQLCREIVARVEHAFSDRRGEWRVCIAGSRAGEIWEMRVEGPDGFERTYSLTGAAGEHEPEAIRRLILQLVATRSS